MHYSCSLLRRCYLFYCCAFLFWNHVHASKEEYKPASSLQTDEIGATEAIKYLTFKKSPVANNYSIYNFSNALILGIVTSAKHYAVAFVDSIVILNFSYVQNSVTYEKSAHISLSTPLEGRLLEFKFLNDTMIIICDIHSCRSCSIIETQDCVTHNLIRKRNDIGELIHVTAVQSVSGNVYIRYVTENAKRASIAKYRLHTANERNDPIQQADDIEIISGHALATAFSRDSYIYFVGSARRAYEPYINAHLGDNLVVMSVRITRLCEQDETSDLESRIDIALICGNIGTLSNAHSLAAEYDEVGDHLIVVIQEFENTGNIACKYSMKDVETAFDDVWNTCQNVTHRMSAKECMKVRDVKDLPSNCYIFTRKAVGHAMRTCSRFGGGHSKRPHGNCELSSFSSSAYRYGWLEQFWPLEGNLHSILPNGTTDIVSMKQFRNDDAMFTVTADGIVERIGFSSEKGQSFRLWSVKMSRNIKKADYRFFFDSDSHLRRFYYVHKNQVKFGELSCGFLYASCESLESANWSDSLRCLWCAMGNGTGYAVSREQASDCHTQLVTNKCPPYIEHVSPSKETNNATLLEAYGGRFDRLQFVDAKVCNEACSITQFTSTKISCLVKIPLLSAQHCNLTISGTLGTFGSYTLSRRTTTSLITQPFPARSRTRSSKVIASVSTIIALLALIGFILWFVRRYHLLQERKKKQADASSLMALGLSSSSVQGKSSVNGCRVEAFNPYESLFAEIDPKLRIPLEDLHFEKEIGKGNYGIVYKAIYRNKYGRTSEVACKTIDAQIDGVITGVREFLREGLIMANFNHPNVTRLIGLSFASTGCPIIITEYLALKDLRCYIVNPENKVTLGTLMKFGIQIAQGMTYLHKKSFIHRDLAARNCMLDSSLIVKIADFGLSRDVSRCGTYQVINKDRGIPIRWMPIESLEQQQFTFKADVWAYGVVLWELVTRGLVPYGNLEYLEILSELKKGRRLSKPKGCPDTLYHQVMLVCWHEDPQKRPTFYELTEMMQDVVNKLQQGIDGGALLREHYEPPRSSATTPVAYPKLGSSPFITYV